MCSLQGAAKYPTVTNITGIQELTFSQAMEVQFPQPPMESSLSAIRGESSSGRGLPQTSHGLVPTSDITTQ
jgi:hypothetical protein